VVAAASAVAAAAKVTVAKKKIFTKEGGREGKRERERWCNHHVRWFDGY
jgi:hypothetical protein